MPELLRRFIGPYKTKTIVAVLTKLVEVGLEVATPLVVARMIDEGVRGKNTQVIMQLGLLLLLFAAVGFGFTFVCQKLAAQVSQGVGTRVRDALYAHINELSLADLDRFGTSSVITRVTNDVSQMQLALAFAIRMGPRWPLLALGSMLAAIAIDLNLGLVFVVCMPLIGLVFTLVMRSSIPLFVRLQQKLDAISLVTRENLEGMRVIRAFNRQRTERERGHAAIASHTKTAVQVGHLSAVLNPATFAIMYAGVGAILWMGGARVSAGTLSAGEVMAFVSYMTQALVAVTAMTNIVVVVMRGQTSSVRILEVLDCEPSLTQRQDAAQVDLDANPKAYAIELCDASFSYEGAKVPALDHVSIRLRAGQTLGIIGGTGSGKSTLVRLLPRLYDTHSGSVSVFGTNVRDYPFHQLRSVVSLVPQDVSLVSGTIRSNLMWRNDHATDGELWDALKTAQAADFVHALEKGLDAPVEVGGKNFSGGQRQRLTIARALVGSPRVLVLDDAASALDFATDARLRKALASLSDRTTTVIVSQRVSAVMGADKICVLDHGRLAGLGTHDELLHSCALYAEICTSQLVGDDGASDEAGEAHHG